MNTELTVPQSANIITRGDDLQVSAFTPDEMLHANAALIQWCDHKIGSLKAEHEELREAYDHAKEKKWKTSTLAKHSGLALKRVEFFVKMRSALQEGFYIVPNFPVTVFAIRTDKKEPLSLLTFETCIRAPGNAKTQTAGMLSEGGGEYRNPFPHVAEYKDGTDDGGKQKWESFATGWQDLEFPISMSKPAIMQATSRAMALKIFDEIGILQESRSGDPIIIGRLIDPRPTASRHWKKHLSFVIAWHINTKVL